MKVRAERPVNAMLIVRACAPVHLVFVLLPLRSDRCGHVPHEEFPALTLEHLVAFLSEIEFCQATTMDDEADQGD